MTATYSKFDAPIPILDNGVYPRCRPKESFIYIYKRLDGYLYSYNFRGIESKIIGNENLENKILTLQINGSNLITYNGEDDKVFNVSLEALGTFSKEEIITLLDNKQDIQEYKTINNESILGIGDISITKSSLELTNVNNTSDLDKPISTSLFESIYGYILFCGAMITGLIIGGKR